MRIVCVRFWHFWGISILIPVVCCTIKALWSWVPFLFVFYRLFIRFFVCWSRWWRFPNGNNCIFIPLKMLRTSSILTPCCPKWLRISASTCWAIYLWGLQHFSHLLLSAKDVLISLQVMVFSQGWWLVSCWWGLCRWWKVLAVIYSSNLWCLTWLQPLSVDYFWRAMNWTDCSLCKVRRWARPNSKYRRDSRADAMHRPFLVRGSPECRSMFGVCLFSGWS